MRRSGIGVSYRPMLTAAVALIFYSMGPAQDGLQTRRGERGPVTPNFLSRMVIPGTGDLQLIIELTDPAVAQAMAAPAAARAIAAAGQGRLRLDSAQAASYRTRIGRAQGLMSDRLRSLNGVQIQASTDLVLNGIIARVPVARYAEIRRLPGVKKVYFSRPLRKNLNAAGPLQNAPALWSVAPGGRANAGQGVKIGIIDTGIDITNPMFVDNSTPLPAGFPKSGPNDAAYTNHKVIVARNYMHLLSNFQRDRTAVDEDGHGSFVAGCAAGKLVNAPLAQISGMAPGAFLGNYKVFGTPGINDFTTTAAVVAAINDAVNDGMDVLNLSLGSLDFIPPSEDPEVIAINGAVSAGLVVALAAGNSGPDTHTISTPGSAQDAIAVGAVWNSRIFAAQLHVTGPGAVPAGLQNIPYVNGTGPEISTAIPSTPFLDVAGLDGTGLACSELPAGSLNGKVALIARGTCTFAVKVTNAAAAGAPAVVVYNNIPGDAPFSMGGLSDTVTPAVMVFHADGLALKDYVAANPGASVRIDTSTNDQVATPVTPVLVSESARGPAADFGMKPDIVAVGWSVYSATQNLYPSSVSMYDASHFTTSQGTSFSTPMVSGAAAAIKQLFPALTPAGIKSVLANTAVPITTDGTNPATIVQAGNGLLDMGRASAASAVFSPSNLNFGVQEYSKSISLTQTLVINNISGGSDQYTLVVQPLVSDQPLQPGPMINLSTSTTGSVSPGGSTSVDVSIIAAAPLSGGFQGFINVRSERTSTTYSIPYWAGIYVLDASRILKVSQSLTGSDIYSNLKDALAAAQPGNIIEFADSQTYAVPLPSSGTDWGISISTNAQGLPLHGITIRAAQGQTPVIDGSNTSALANLQITGLRKVLIQGLTIAGGQTGIDILQPSPSVPVSVTIDHCEISGMAASSSAAGVYVGNGGDVAITYSTVSGCSGAGVISLNGTNLIVSGSTVRENRLDGIEAFECNVDLLGSTFMANEGVGAYLENCSGTLSGNTFAANTGPFGDGIELGDGRMTVQGNTFDSNESAGIYLFAASFTGSGPAARLERNVIRSNGGYGVQSDAAHDLQMSANLIQDNGVGYYANGSTSAVLANNIITGSTDATQGSGIDVGDTTMTRIVNNTIYQNRRNGIALSQNANVSVFNTIVSQNALGDLSGLSANQIQYSLISDGSMSGNNNISGDPGFRDPAGGDFTLTEGSRAIDAGSNAIAPLPYLDYNQKLRVAGPIALPGEGTVDMGAIEAGSYYPLNYPMLVSGDNSALGDAFITGFAALNDSSDPAMAEFSAYGPSGILLGGQSNPALRDFPANLQQAVFDYQLFGFARGEAKVGAVLGSSLQKLSGFFLIFDQQLSRLADGVDVSSDTCTDCYFMRHQSDSNGQTTYQVFNPGANSANVVARLMSSSGIQMDAPRTSTLPPKGQFTFTFNNVDASSGYVRVTSDQPVSGLEIYGNTAEIAALPAVPAGTEARLFFPQIAVNTGYASFIGVLNTSTSSATLMLDAYGNDGNVLGQPAQRTLGPGGQLLESAQTLFGLEQSGDLITGYVVVKADQPGIAGFCAFQYTDSTVQSYAAVPAQSVPRQRLLLSHVAHQVPAGTGGNYLTGIALLNPYGTAIAYTLKVFDSSGVQVDQLSDTLGPHAKVAKLLSHPLPGAGFFTRTMPLSGGHIEVTTDYQLLGYELFFTESLTQLAAVMAQFPDR